MKNSIKKFTKFANENMDEETVYFSSTVKEELGEFLKEKE
jgi:hypothetical protein